MGRFQFDKFEIVVCECCGWKFLALRDDHRTLCRKCEAMVNDEVEKATANNEANQNDELANEFPENFDWKASMEEFDRVCSQSNETPVNEAKDVHIQRKQCEGVSYKSVYIDSDSVSVKSAPENQQNSVKVDENMLPSAIKKRLDEHVIGQEQAKRVLAVAAYNHQKIINNPELQIEKSNIMMIGPSGCGKTYLIKTLAEVLDVPCVIVNSTSMTANGYTGEDAESALLRLYRKAYSDVNGYSCDEEHEQLAIRRAEKGIVFIDEIDKKAVRGNNNSRDVCGESVQHAFLKLVEGTNVSLQGTTSSTNEDPIILNTKNILFIVSGAFAGIEEIISKRLGSTKNEINLLGKNVAKAEDDYNALIDSITTDDVRKYGMLQEFVGRFPVICTLHQLSEEDLVNILTGPKNSIVMQYKKLMSIDNVDLYFQKEALQQIAKLAMRNKTGARGLRSQMEKILFDVMYNVKPSEIRKRVRVNGEDVKRALQ